MEQMKIINIGMFGVRCSEGRLNRVANIVAHILRKLCDLGVF